MKGKPNNTVKIRQISVCLLPLIVGQRVLADEADSGKLPPPAKTQIVFARDIRPIFESNCLRCHGPEKPKSRFRLDNRPDALKGGDEGVDILPGNSAKSPLIHYVAHLVDDMEMPPLDKGTRLTPDQVSLLRAWIDQGAVWDPAKPTNSLVIAISPIFGGTKVHGDHQKYQEQYWQKEGLNGGLDDFEAFEQTSPHTKLLVNGHALRDDYKISLAADHTDLGFIHSDWEQYRKYFDDTGGYTPGLGAPNLHQDLFLDIGKASIDFGLTLPDWPRLVLGYEYDYKLGNEASADWGVVGNPPNQRNIAPTPESLNESVHIIKFDLDDEIKGVTVEDRFRGEFYKLSTGITNTSYMGPQTVNQSTSYFQGANTLRLEKKFSDWFFGSAGYLYSQMTADSAFNMDAPSLNQVTAVPQINLERNSNVGNLNGIIGPFNGLTISTGVQAEWTRQHGSSTDGTFDQESQPPSILDPFTLASDYDQTSVQEDIALRYTKIPFTSLFVDAQLEQQIIKQYDQFSAVQDILDKAVFLQNTDFSSQSSDLRVGFSTSPWRSAALTVQYHRTEDDSQYDSAPLIQPVGFMTAYPTFIRSRDLITDDVEAKLALNSSARFKTSLSYQYQTTEYDVDTGSFAQSGTVIAPGGQLIAGEETSQIFSINATMIPTPRLFLSTTLSYQNSRTTTAAAGSPSVAPYRGDIYSVLADGTYVLSQTTDLIVGYAFSMADYGQNNFVDGLPLGIQYQEHTAQLGLSRHFGKNVWASLQYRFSYYNEPSIGGASNFTANSIFGTLSFRFP